MDIEKEDDHTVISPDNIVRVVSMKIMTIGDKDFIHNAIQEYTDKYLDSTDYIGPIYYTEKQGELELQDLVIKKYDSKLTPEQLLMRITTGQSPVQVIVTQSPFPLSKELLVKAGEKLIVKLEVEKNAGYTIIIIMCADGSKKSLSDRLDSFKNLLFGADSNADLVTLH